VAKLKNSKSRLIGPNCPGVISPGKSQDRHHAGQHSQRGFRRHRLPLRHADLRGRLPTHAARHRPIDGDWNWRRPHHRTTHIDALRLFNNDPETEAIVLIGEIGGSAEEAAAAFVKKHVKKPVVGFIAGQTAPPGRRMGHAGAIISGGQGTAADKMKAMTEAGIHVVVSPAEIGATLARVIGRA